MQQTSGWQDTYLYNKYKDHDKQLIAHTSFYVMCYDAQNKNKVRTEDQNLVNELLLVKLLREARAAIWKCTGQNCIEKADYEKFH